MAGITNGSEWISVGTLKQILGRLPDTAQVQASPLGNLVIYEEAGPIRGKMIAYIDLLTETLDFDEQEPVEQLTG